MSAGPTMGFRAFMATEGGRKCPQCGKYAKSSELGNLSFNYKGGRVSMYGHLPGFGCNKEKNGGPQ